MFLPMFIIQGESTMQYIKDSIEYNNKRFALHRFEPENKNLNGMVQIIHGMAEDMKRYQEFAEFFTGKGFLVFGIDNLGHGETVSLNNGKLGYFDENDGWKKVVNSNKYLSKLMKKEYPKVPLIIYGHSLGSIIGRYYLIGEKVPQAMILSGTFVYQNILMDFLKVLAKIEKAINSGDSINSIDNYLMTLIYQRKFDKNTENSWLSSDQKVVNEYNQNRKYGFKITNQMFIDLFEGLKTIDKLENNREISKDIPLLLISGANDPVSNFGNDIKKLFKTYKNANLKDLKYKIYNGLRHETIRDKRKEEVYNDLQEWILDHI